MDGIVPLAAEVFYPSPKVIQEIISIISEHRSNMKNFDIVVNYTSLKLDSSKREELVSEYIDAGSTWLLECIDMSTSKEDCLKLIEQGPPEI